MNLYIFITKHLLLFFFISILVTIISCQNQQQTDKKSIHHEKNNIKNNQSLTFKNKIISIFEDSKNNFWFGSEEKGLCKFNGATYQYFTTQNGLPSNLIRNIQEDHKGNIWITTGKGICYFDGNQFIKVEVKKEWNITSFQENTTSFSKGQWSVSEESLWFMTFKDGVLRYDNELEYLEIPIPVHDTTVRQEQTHIPYASYKVLKDNQNKLWIGTFNRGVVEYNHQSFKYHNPDQFGIGTIRALFQDQSGNYWFGSNGGGLYFYDGNQYTNFTKKHQLVNPDPMKDQLGTLSRVWAIAQDNDGNMWFGTADSGLWKYNGQQLTNYTMEDGLPSNFVEIILKDSQGKLWFCSGINGNGIVYTLEDTGFEVLN